MELVKRTVVIVGPNGAARRALQLSLNLEGYGVQAAETSSEARHLIDKHWPEAVIIDVSESSPEYLALARNIRHSKLHKHVVIVASAPISFADQERAAYEAGCDAFLLQAGQTRELAELLDAYLSVGTAPATGHEDPCHWN